MPASKHQIPGTSQGLVKQETMSPIEKQSSQQQERDSLEDQTRSIRP
jgi:hypothetical protein